MSADSPGLSTFDYPIAFNNAPFVALRSYYGAVDHTANQFDVAFIELSNISATIQKNTVGGSRETMLFFIGS